MRSFTVTKVFGLIVLVLLQMIPLNLLPLPAVYAEDDQYSHQKVDFSKLQFEAAVAKPETGTPTKNKLAAAAPLPKIEFSSC